MKRNTIGLPGSYFDRMPEPSGGTGDPAPPPPPAAPKPITFATQADLDAVIAERLDRGVRSRLRELGLSGPQDAEELTTLRTDKAERDRKALEEKANYEAAKKSIEEAGEARLRSVKESLDATVGILRSERVDNAILTAASELQAHKPAHVVKLLRDRVKLSDDGQFTPTVLGDDGKPMFNAGRAVTVRELVEGFLLAEPTLRKATGDGGSGAGGGGAAGDQGGAPDQGTEITRLTKAHADAQKLAEKSPTIGNITAVTSARRALEAAQKAAIAKGTKIG